MLRLPYAVSDLFIDWLDNHFPEKKNKILNRVRSVRKGKLNVAEFGKRMKGEGIFAEQVKDLFDLSCKKNGIPDKRIKLSVEHFRNPDDPQQDLFGNN